MSSLVKEILGDISQGVQMIGGEARCLICNKKLTVDHLQSFEHVKRIEEYAIGKLMGPLGHGAFTTRGFNGDLCRGVPTKKSIKEFWGDALTFLPRAARASHIKMGRFYYGRNIALLPEEAEYELGIVNYPCWNASKRTYIPYHELPDEEEYATDLQRRTTLPPGQGWWPVIALQKVVNGQNFVKKVLVVCWYQLRAGIADGRVVCLWIYVRR